MFCGSIETYLDFLTHQAGRRSRSGLLAKKYVKGPTSARGKVVKVPRQREEKMYKGTSRLFVHSTRDTHLTSEAKGNLAEKRKQVQTSHALKSLNEWYESLKVGNLAMRVNMLLVSSLMVGRALANQTIPFGTKQYGSSLVERLWQTTPNLKVLVSFPHRVNHFCCLESDGRM